MLPSRRYVRSLVRRWGRARQGGGEGPQKGVLGGSRYPAVEMAITWVPAGATTKPSVAAGVLNWRADPRLVE